MRKKLREVLVHNTEEKREEERRTAAIEKQKRKMEKLGHVKDSAKDRYDNVRRRASGEAQERAAWDEQIREQHTKLNAYKEEDKPAPIVAQAEKYLTPAEMKD